MPDAAWAADGLSLPHSLSELNDWYETPAQGQNAATFFLRGAKALNISDADRRSRDLPWIGLAPIPNPDEPLSPVTLRAMAGFLERNQSRFSYFEDGAKCNGSRYPLDFKGGLMTLLPHLSQVKFRVCGFLEVYAVWCANAHRGQPAAEAVKLIFAATASLTPEPLLVSQRIRFECAELGVQSLEQVVNRASVSTEDLEGIRSLISRLEHEDASGANLYRGLVGQHILSMDWLDLPVPERISLLSKFNLNPTNAVADTEDRKSLEELFQRFITIAHAPFPERFRTMKALCSTEIVKEKGHFMGEGAPRMVRGTLEDEARYLAWLAVGRTAIALEEFRNAHAGQYPAELKELLPNHLPSIPTDPVKGSALNYHRTENGYTLACSTVPKPEDVTTNSPTRDEIIFHAARQPQ